MALLLAIVLVLYRNDIVDVGILAVSLIIGGLVGTFIAMKVTMIQIPAMVAFQHGAGGIAACAIAYVELTRATPPTPVGEVSGYLGLTIGAATFSGSMLASAKLAGKLRQTPTVLSGHNAILLAMLAAIIGLCVYASTGVGVPEAATTLSAALVGALVLSVALGYTFAVRIGGADMPVLISFLNATAGLAAAFCGVVIQNQLLIACGATVAASGSILTAIMCKAMNRSFISVIAGGFGTTSAAPKPAGGAAQPAGEVVSVNATETAQRVVNRRHAIAAIAAAATATAPTAAALLAVRIVPVLAIAIRGLGAAIVGGAKLVEFMGEGCPSVSY